MFHWWEQYQNFWNDNEYLFRPHFDSLASLYSYWDNATDNFELFIPFSQFLREFRDELAATFIQKRIRGNLSRRQTRQRLTERRTLTDLHYSYPQSNLYLFDPLHIYDIERYL